jgi:hypothetical protein
MQSLAISLGVTGRVALCSRVVKDPVIAQLKMVDFMVTAEGPQDKVSK